MLPQPDLFPRLFRTKAHTEVTILIAQVPRLRARPFLTSDHFIRLRPVVSYLCKYPPSTYCTTIPYEGEPAIELCLQDRCGPGQRVVSHGSANGEEQRQGYQYSRR